MLKKIKNVYKQNGVKGLFFSGTAKILSLSGKALLNTGDLVGLAAGNYRFFLTQAERDLLKRNKIFKDKHKGKRCFIIGNGPSLKTQDMSPLAHEITFVMSAFWKHPAIEKWQPTYYCFVDPLFFDHSETLKEFFQSLNLRIHDATFFVPLDAAGIIRQQDLLPLDKTYYAGFHHTAGKDSIQSINLVKRLPYVMGVSQLAIMVAMYMGCSPIYLLGHDHNWLSHRGLEQHFYEGNAGLEKHPEFFPTLNHWSYKYLMECQLKLWRIYEKLSVFSHGKGIQIFNATDGGFLDLFERVSYEAMIKKKLASRELL